MPDYETLYHTLLRGVTDIINNTPREAPARAALIELQGQILSAELDGRYAVRLKPELYTRVTIFAKDTRDTPEAAANFLLDSAFCEMEQRDERIFARLMQALYPEGQPEKAKEGVSE